jgi:hypothetical protein
VDKLPEAGPFSGLEREFVGNLHLGKEGSRRLLIESPHGVHGCLALFGESDEGLLLLGAGVSAVLEMLPEVVRAACGLG